MMKLLTNSYLPRNDLAPDEKEFAEIASKLWRLAENHDHCADFDQVAVWAKLAKQRTKPKHDRKEFFEELAKLEASTETQLSNPIKVLVVKAAVNFLIGVGALLGLVASLFWGIKSAWLVAPIAIVWLCGGVGTSYLKDALHLIRKTERKRLLEGLFNAASLSDLELAGLFEFFDTNDLRRIAVENLVDALYCDDREALCRRNADGRIEHLYDWPQ